jgi:hypothetical protein
VLGVVFELFIVEEDLLAGSKYKLGAAVAALQYSIGEFHVRLPRNRDMHRNRLWLPVTCRLRFPVSVRVAQQGPGPHQKISGAPNLVPVPPGDEERRSPGVSPAIKPKHTIATRRTVLTGFRSGFRDFEWKPPGAALFATG